MAAHTLVALTFLFSSALLANAESHTVRFENNCGYGHPVLMAQGQTLSTGEDYTSSGPLSSAIAYLQTGNCDVNGEKCTLMEMTLGNPTCEGCGSSADLSLIPTHAFSVTTSFSYFNGCDGTGAICDNANCNTAFFVPDDNQVQVSCQTDNVDLLISFCANAMDTVKSGFSSSTPKASSTKASSTKASSTKAASTEVSSSKAATSSAVVAVEAAPSTSEVSTSASASATAKKCTAAQKKRRAAKREAELAAREPIVVPAAHKRGHGRHLSNEI